MGDDVQRLSVGSVQMTECVWWRTTFYAELNHVNEHGVHELILYILESDVEQGDVQDAVMYYICT